MSEDHKGWKGSPTAARMRDTIIKIAVAVVERERPPYRYGIVESVDTESATCNVVLTGDEESVPVKVYSGYPGVGDSVRVVGLRGDRYVDAVIFTATPAEEGPVLPAPGDEDSMLAVYAGSWIVRTLAEIRSTLEVVRSTQFPVCETIALSSETVDLVTGAGLDTWYLPFGFTLTEAQLTVTTASSSGIVRFDVNKNGASIFSTRVSCDTGEHVSNTAATPQVITTSSFAAGDAVSFDCDDAGTGVRGAKITLIGYRSL